MNVEALLPVVPLAIIGVVIIVIVYRLGRYGWKGARFGYPIYTVDDKKITYRRRSTNCTFRLYKLDSGNLYGIEIGQWTGLAGETAMYAIPEHKLLELRDRITEFVETTGKYSFPDPTDETV
ncbi:hypothetical protein [Thalassoroseus pseudoceratinae]|uniref:hypothetical protein n=1 Tax=Thalassoroseus pseudoceratinae TaxID=2713176 RepID=UPI001422AAEE|nr:hypothetical protein [Thalassoroseus pseudoceratinae]